MFRKPRRKNDSPALSLQGLIFPNIHGAVGLWPAVLLTAVVLPLVITGCWGGSENDTYEITRVGGDGGVINIEARAKAEGAEQRVALTYDSAEGGWRRCIYWSDKTTEHRSKRGGECGIDSAEVQKNGLVVAEFAMEVFKGEAGTGTRVSGRLEASGATGLKFRKRFGL